MLKSTRLNQSGFSLVEVLVAAFLVVIILASILPSSFSSRDDLDNAVTSIERAIRFSINESTLRNKVMRIHFMLASSPQEFAVEYGPDGTFILPPSRPTQMGLKEEEKFREEYKRVNKEFTKLKEFEDENSQIDEYIQIIGIGSSIQEELVFDYETSIYVYPTGEKDSAIIIIGSDEEVVSIIVDPFTQKLTREYSKLELMEGEDLYDAQQKLAKEIFERWLK